MGREYGECHGYGEGVIKVEADTFNVLSIQLLGFALSYRTE